MKKFITITMVLLMIIIGSEALSDEIDLKSMSDSDLVRLCENIQVELATRDLFGEHVLWPGFYEFGKDYEPGYYSLICVGMASTDEDDGYGYIDVIKDGEWIGDSVISGDRNHKIGSGVKAKFDEGMILEVRHALFTISKLGQ